MTAPTLANMQYQYKDTGVALNTQFTGATPIIDVSGIDGLDTPNVRLIQNDRDGAHGGYVFSQYMSTRAIALDFTIYDNVATIEATIDTLKANFAPSAADQPFYFKWPSVGQRLAYGKAQGLRYKVDPGRSLGIQACSVQILCSDPRTYDSTASTASSSWPSITSSGRVYPKRFPYTYGAIGSGGVLNPNNAGTVETYPIITISGSVVAPTIVNTTTGQTMTLTGTVGSPNPLIIDCQAGTITTGGVDVTGLLAANSDWIALVPGVNNITFGAISADPGATFTIDWRSAYL